jgi:ATP-dependent Lon protease
MNKRYITLAVNKAVFAKTVGIAEFLVGGNEYLEEFGAAKFNIVLVPVESGGDAVAVGSLGVVAEIDQVLLNKNDPVGKIAYRADALVRVEKTFVESGLRCALVTAVDYTAENHDLVANLFDKAREVYEEYLKTSGARRQAFSLLTLNANINAIAARVGGASQTLFRLFNELSTEERLLIFITLLGEKLVTAEIDKKVSKKVQEAIDLNHREYYVREQIKALSQEIGDDEDDVEEYFVKIDRLLAADTIKEKLKKEARRIKKTAPSSPEMAILKNYLDTALELPWGIYTEDNDNLATAQTVLDDDHFGLDKVKERLIEALAVRKLSKDGRSPIICLVGPPGIGKTSIASSIATAMNKKFVRLSFGGVRDEAEIRGHRKTYVGAMPGRIVTSIKTAGSMNPVFLMDEIDKMASDFKGDPAAALLEVLDPEQNINFRDHFLELPFDLSKVLFITTANTLDTISRPLLDRMEVIEMTGYTELEKLEIAKRHLINKSLKLNGVQQKWVKINDAAILAIINLYTRESGLRGLEKKINAVMRKVARKFVENPNEKAVNVTTKNLADFLGEPKFRHKEKLNQNEIGIATGLAWTAVGGDTLSIEVIVTEGKGEVILTGNLGDVMKESAKIAISYLKSVAKDTNIDINFFQKHDIHIHVPEGATPKDGPSAGITIATALYSAITKKKVDSSVAMTGELTLRGNVLPIGGLKEKTLAAVRAGVKKVFIPEDNKSDYKELPDNIKEKLEFVFVGNVKNVISQAVR